MRHRGTVVGDGPSSTTSTGCRHHPSVASRARGLALVQLQDWGVAGAVGPCDVVCDIANGDGGGWQSRANCTQGTTGQTAVIEGFKPEPWLNKQHDQSSGQEITAMGLGCKHPPALATHWCCPTGTASDTVCAHCEATTTARPVHRSMAHTVVLLAHRSGPAACTRCSADAGASLTLQRWGRRCRRWGADVGRGRWRADVGRWGRGGRCDVGPRRGGGAR